jgi:hypothetical protein
LDGINRDIVKKVLGIDGIESMTVTDDTIMVNDVDYNIYYFAYVLCKKWASENDSILFTATDGDTCLCIVNLHDGGYEHIVYCDTEHEAIFECINWIIFRHDMD